MSTSLERAPERQRSLLWTTIRSLVPSVVLPVAVYVVLTKLGVSDLWSLVSSSAMSVLVVGWAVARTRKVPTLAVIVLLRFAAGVAVAVSTGDARLTLAKDPAFTLLVAVAALLTLLSRRPLTARIRRDLTPDPDDFDRRWRDGDNYRRSHRRFTVVWAIGLAAESAVGFAIVGLAPLNAAVLATRILGPVVLLTLAAWTVRADHRASVGAYRWPPTPWEQPTPPNVDR